MQRYFCDIIDNHAILNDEDKHHFLNVMRANKNEEVEIVFNGKTFIGELTDQKNCVITIKKELDENHELKNKLILYLCLLKGEKMDLVLQKATELGVSEIILIQSERSISKIEHKDEEKKLLRFNKILKEAAQQSKRNFVPKCKKILSFNEIKNGKTFFKFIGDVNDSLSTEELKNKLNNRKSDDEISILIGPEGGFSDKELKYAHECGFESISFGKRVLRAETAAISSIAIISFLLGD